jgi:hypothetical protein
VTEDEKQLKRIRDREERQELGPVKWQIIDQLKTISAKLGEMTTAIQDLATQYNQSFEKLHAHNETARKLSEAGKKSAAARKAKFGSARPGGPVFPTQPELSVVPDPVREGVRKKKEPLVTDGGIVWQAYHMAYRERYGVDPLRNAKVNAQCKELAKQIGVERACTVVCYYVERNDAFYVNAKHPLGLCILNLQKLVTERETNTVVTMTDARRVESHSQTDRAIREYAARQEGVREQVHVKGVENADS